MARSQVIIARAVGLIEGQMDQRRRAPPLRRRAEPARKPIDPPPPPAGQVARRFAVFVVDAVLTHRRALDEAIVEAASKPQASTMPPRDRAFGRLIATTALRHLGQIEYVLAKFIEKPLPAEIGRLRAILAPCIGSATRRR